MYMHVTVCTMHTCMYTASHALTEWLKKQLLLHCRLPSGRQHNIASVNACVDPQHDIKSRQHKRPLVVSHKRICEETQ